MLRYCAWCGQFQGAKAGNGVQVRGNRSEIDTSTICPRCMDRMTASAGREMDRTQSHS